LPRAGIGEAEQTGCGHYHPLAPTESVEGDQDSIADLQMLDAASHRQDAADTLITDEAGQRRPNWVCALNQI
jgi:hypothetical protein